MLDEAYDHVTQVQNVKKKKGQIREINNGTTRVDANRLSSQWFPDIATGLDAFVSGYATQQRGLRTCGLCGSTEHIKGPKCTMWTVEMAEGKANKNKSKEKLNA